MDESAKKSVLGMIPYGVFICTSKYGDIISASTVTWVTQTSFDPPLIAVALKKESGVHETVRNAGKFVLHVVPDGEKKLASRFFRPAQVEENKINGVSFSLAHGLPVLQRAPAHLVCRVRQVPEIGDHHLFIGEIIDAVSQADVAPLLLKDTGWRYSG